MRMMGFLALIPTAVLLTASFFVLFAAEKVAARGLKMFGKAVAALLIIIAALVFSKGVYTVVTGECPMMKMAQEMCPMMGAKEKGMRRPEMSDKMRRMHDKAGRPMRQGETTTMPGDELKK
jgi:hypothetical protein